MSWAARGAVAWCLVFAAVHAFWAAGGSVGLASSAGQRLADERPTSFVLLGLVAVAAVLVCGAAVVVVMVTTANVFLRRLLRYVVLVAGAGLAVRGLGVAVALALDLGGIRRQVGPAETFWSQVLWNPWFLLGGVLMVVAAVQVRRRTAGTLH